MDVMTLPGGVRRLAREGTTFPNSFVSYPLCCPARATFLTGQYAHNNGVLENGPPSGGYAQLDHTRTLPVWLQEAGYHTAHIGKYLNGYGVVDPVEIPPGWTEWYGSVDPFTYGYFYYRVNENGQVVLYGGTDADYQTDVYTAKAEKFIRERAADSHPFFLWVAFVAPHIPHTPAPRHAGRFAELPLPRPPSFNEADISDKPAATQLPIMSEGTIADVEKTYRERMETLLAVDEAVERMIKTLEESGKADDTLVIFTSDNGYFHGEHRIPIEKRRVYEEAIRVPLILRGPGIPAGATIDPIAVNVDLAPTILDYAGAEDLATRIMDGRSLKIVMRNPATEWRRDFLSEIPVGIPGSNVLVKYSAVRARYEPCSSAPGGDYLYAEYDETADIELYNMTTDPYQLESLHGSAAPQDECVRNALRERLKTLRTCSGSNCW